MATYNVDESKNSTVPATIGDGFDGYVERTEGDDRPAGQGLIKGTLLRFGATAQWETRDSEVIDGSTKLVAIDVIRAVVKWGADKKPEQTIIVPSGQPMPDVAEMNEAVPRPEWRQGLNGPQGPWQAQKLVVLVDPMDMSFFTFATSAIGGFIAIDDLVRKTQAMRKWRGPVSPVVTLDDLPMKTKFGERRRPHFNVVDWIRMGGGGAEPQLPVLPAPKPDSSSDGGAAPVQAAPVKTEVVSAVETAKAEPGGKKRRTQSKAFAVGDNVKPLMTREEMNDDIPW
jgi:hypothetical protein